MPHSQADAAPRRRLLVIVNPTAGRHRAARRRLDSVLAALRRRGCTVVLQTAAEIGDAERLARAAPAEFDAIVAAGGDGTLQAVANGVAAMPRPIAMLPFGTVNVLAHEIGLPRHPERLAEIIAGGPVRPIWPGRIGDRLFLLMAGCGFDAEVVARVSLPLKRRLGRFAYVAALLACLRDYRGCELSVRIDGVEHRAATVIAAKARCYAGGHVIAPAANLGEPALDLVLFRRGGRLAVLRYAAALLRGSLPSRRDLRIIRCREAEIVAGRALPVQADGELVARLPVTIRLAERPLPLIHPPQPQHRQCVESATEGRTPPRASALVLWFCGRQL